MNSLIKHYNNMELKTCCESSGGTKAIKYIKTVYYI